MELVVSSVPQLRGKNCCFYSQMNKHYLIHVHLQVFRDDLDEAANFTRPKMDSSVGGFRIRYALRVQSLAVFSQVKGWISAGPLPFNKMLVLLSMITTQSHISGRTFQGGRTFQAIKVCQLENKNWCFGCMFRAYLQVIPYHFPSYTFLYTMFYTELFEKMVSTHTHTQPPKPATCKAKKRSQLLNIQNTNSKHYKQIYLAPELFIIYPFSTLPSETHQKL